MGRLRGRYLPFALLGGVVLLVPLGIQPALVFAYPFAFVAAAAADREERALDAVVRPATLPALLGAIMLIVALRG
ncbi:hypothetical protein [Haloplanus aerogenes]|uniref:Uncharacterized protein n=1 Tax=Haloplanus aerogenes TaxID=660522 RepID=A0A3M0CVN4_9EURY|nr:hypothetical protein [Haloplanus aerogenes]AZH23870.1 hypothetical protein DU502_00110 [Haloplanus aerogenes]RMB13371.1 hypothetical protein ATH50_2704 [Haloplanus aerogenes]